MGKNMDSIVVDTEKTAIDCINYMKEQRAGHATFLPLDKIVVKPVNEKYKAFCKGARLALDILQFDASYERVIRYSVGNAMVADTIDIARHICYEKREEVKVVTIDGTVFHKTGNITGGQIDGGHARKWEQKEVEDLTKLRESLLAEVSDVIKQKRKVSQDDHLVSEITGNENRISRLEDELAETIAKIKGCEQELEFNREQLGQAQDEVGVATESMNQIRTTLEKVDQIIVDAETAAFSDFCIAIGVSNIREYEAANLRDTLGVAEKRLEYRTAKSKLEELIAFDRQRLDEFKSRADSIQASLDQLQKKQDDLKSRKNVLATKSSEILDDKESIDNQLQQSKKNVKEKANDLIHIKKEISSLVHNFEEISKTMGALESKLEVLNNDKLAVVRKCKVEEISLDLVDDATLDDFPIEKLDVLFR